MPATRPPSTELQAIMAAGGRWWDKTKQSYDAWEGSEAWQLTSDESAVVTATQYSLPLTVYSGEMPKGEAPLRFTHLRGHDQVISWCWSPAGAGSNAVKNAWLTGEGQAVPQLART